MPRIYAPLTTADLAELVAGRSVTPTSWSHAPAGLAGDELEQAEYDALVEAAAAGAALVGAGTRRIVLAADVDALPAGGSLAVAPRQVASVHVDETSEHADEDLLWYDASELAALLAELG